MHCAACRAVLPEAAKFCTHCGAPASPVCDACGFANPSAANFCAQCGAGLRRAISNTESTTPKKETANGDRASVERRQLTVLFCDLVGSTLLAARFDPEELREIIGAYHRSIAATVEAFGGFVARYMGDGALVYFGYPHAYEDNAERAVRAALALVTNVTALTVLKERLHVRVGIATGLVVVGELVSAGAAREETALGETPNLAARLQAIAEPDTVVIAESTRRLVDGLFECDDLGPIPMAGFASPIRAFRVTREEQSVLRFKAYDSSRLSPMLQRARVEPTPLVGRAQELGLLADCWKQARDGQGRAVLVVGDPGIGKSRLVHAVTAQLQAEPHAYLEFRCSAYHVNSPLYPVIGSLPTILDWSRDDGNDVRLQKLEAFCERHRLSVGDVMPLLCTLLSLPASDRFPMHSMSPERQRQRTLEILTSIALSFAKEKPLVIVVEDLHWIDPTSKQLLMLIVDQVPTVPLLVMLTARLEFDPPWQPQSYLTGLTLTRLARSEIEEMIAHHTGNRPLPVEVVDEIVSRSDGVPLFVEELVKAVLESELVELQGDRYVMTGPLPPLAIPTTLQDSLAARLDRLSAIKPLAQLCATLGREFSYPLLKEVSGIDEATLQRSLGMLVHAEFLHQRGMAGEAAYVFKHAMIQEAAYQSLLKSRRQQYHERIARVVVEKFPDASSAHPEVVALHYTRAGDVKAAVGWWQRAGQHAFRRASYAEAIAHYTNGLRALEGLPEDRARDQSELALRVELGYALIPMRGWGSPETAQAFSRAGDLCRQIGDSPSQFRALWGLAAFHFVRGDQFKAREIAVQCLELARQVNDEDAHIEAHYMMGIVECARGQFAAACAELEESARRYGTEPREMHRLLYGQDARASALGWLALALSVMGHPDEAIAKAHEALDFVRGTKQPFLIARGLASVGFVRVFRRDPGGPDTELPAAQALCAEQRFTYFHAVVSTFQGENLVLLGSVREGIAMMESSMRALKAMGSELLATPIYAHLASAHLALGQIDEALAAVDAGLSCVARNDEHWAESELLRLKGEALGARGTEAAAVESCLREALAVARGQGARSYELRAATALARDSLRKGRALEARSVLEETLLWWPSGLVTPDLVDARALLARLA